LTNVPIEESKTRAGKWLGFFTNLVRCMNQEITNAADEDHGRNRPNQYWHDTLLILALGDITQRLQGKFRLDDSGKKSRSRFAAQQAGRKSMDRAVMLFRR
jgi:hypothetical protein